jgi:hypothetical protein
MRALLGALLVISFVSQAAAQLAVGPIAITNNVNGIPITVSATSQITVNSDGKEFTVGARISVDLIDLQKKFSNVVDSFRRPAGNCANRSADGQSPVVSFSNGSLWPRSDQLIMFVRGDIDLWSCVAGPRKSAIRWQQKKIAFVKLKLPVWHTWRNIRKNKDGTQPFRGTVPVYLVEKEDATVALRIAKPDIMLDGQEAFATSSNMNLVMVDINQKAHSAIRSVIDLEKLKDVLPKELQKLNMTVVSARFRDRGGHAIAEINLAAKAPGDATTLMLQQMVASYAKQN